MCKLDSQAEVKFLWLGEGEGAWGVSTKKAPYVMKEKEQKLCYAPGSMIQHDVCVYSLNIVSHSVCLCQASFQVPRALRAGEEVKTGKEVISLELNPGCGTNNRSNVAGSSKSLWWEKELRLLVLEPSSKERKSHRKVPGQGILDLCSQCDS